MSLYKKKYLCIFVGVSLLLGACSSSVEQRLNRKNIDIVLENDPKNSDAYNLRGISYARSDQYDKAIEDFTNAIRLKSDFYQAYYNRGHVYLKMGHENEAIRNFNKAIILKPNYSQAYLSRGKLYYLLKDYRKALKDTNKAIRFSSVNAEAYFYKGLIYQIQKKYSEAYHEFTSAIALGYVTEDILYKRVVTGIKLAHYTEVIEDIEQLLKMNPLNYRAFSLLGLIYEKTHKNAQAKKAYKRALKIKPGHAFSLERLNVLREKDM